MVSDVCVPCAGKFSPFHGFSRMMSQHANVRDGGTSVDGVSRAGLNKLVGSSYQEGMRKPARNGNPGDLDSPGACKLARHFLKARWRDPDDQEDCMVLQQMFSIMQRHEVDHCIAVLRDFSQWRPGPAGRGGDRASGVRGSSEAGLDAVDAVLRNVRQRIEASRSEHDCSHAGDDDDEDDDCDDDMSTRSTVVASAPASYRHSPPAPPVDKVQAIKGLIDDIRNRSICFPHNSVGINVGQAHVLSQLQSHRSSPQWPPNRTDLLSAAPCTKSTSSVDLLNSLFRQVAAQQACQPTLHAPVPTTFTLPQLFSPTSITRASTVHFSAPARNDIDYASSARVQALCAAACIQSEQRAKLIQPFGSVQMPDNLTLPPLKNLTMLPSISQILMNADR